MGSSLLTAIGSNANSASKEWDRNEPRPIRVLDFMETTWISGPAKNLIQFAQRAGRENRAASQVEMAIATFERGASREPNEFIRFCHDAGFEVHVIRERFAFDPKLIRAVCKLIESHEPDIIQTHSIKSHFLMRLTGAHRRYRWIAFHHGYTLTDLRMRLYNQFDRWSLPAALRVVTVCQPFASNLQQIGVPAERIRIRHNSIPPFFPGQNEAVAELRRALGLSRDTRVLLSVGRLSLEKGQADLIKALALLENQGKQGMLRVIFVGEGPDRARLERIARKWGVYDRVIFVGHQHDVTSYYSLADVMVLPSWTEGSPNVLLEAMAAGLPIVATAVGGIPEMVTPLNAALLVERKQPTELANSIARVLDSEELRNKLRVAARAAASNYSPDLYCDALLNLYRECMAEPKPSPDRKIRRIMRLREQRDRI